MMSILIPVKSLYDGKSRLSSVLGDDERCSLNQLLLERTVQLAKECTSIVVLITGCKKTFDFMQKLDVITLLETPIKGLNGALEQGTDFLRSKKVEKILILPSDLPKITKSDIEALLVSDEDEVVIVTDRIQSGTNALLVSPKMRFTYHFGENSLDLHIEEAGKRDLKVSVIQEENVSFDLDTPEDYLEYIQSCTAIT